MSGAEAPRTREGDIDAAWRARKGSADVPNEAGRPGKPKNPNKRKGRQKKRAMFGELLQRETTGTLDSEGRRLLDWCKRDAERKKLRKKN